MWWHLRMSSWTSLVFQKFPGQIPLCIYMHTGEVKNLPLEHCFGHCAPFRRKIEERNGFTFKSFFRSSTIFKTFFEPMKSFIVGWFAKIWPVVLLIRGLHLNWLQNWFINWNWSNFYFPNEGFLSLSYQLFIMSTMNKQNSNQMFNKTILTWYLHEASGCITYQM